MIQQETRRRSRIKYLLLGGVLATGLTSCQQTRLEPLRLPAWVTSSQHLQLEITQDEPGYRFALSCTSEHKDGSLLYSDITIVISGEEGRNATSLPQPDVDCEQNKGKTVATGVLPLPLNTQAGDRIYIILKANQTGIGGGQATHEYELGTNNKLYEVITKSWP